MRRWLPAAAAALAIGTAAILSVRGQGPAPQRPNVVLIVTDDVGYADIGSYGAADIRTPNIDSLAADGVKLTDFYANAMLCSATRAGLITGRYQARYAIEGALGNANSPAAEQGLLVTGRSMPQLVKNNGYATALIGKWHLGYKPEFSPNAHGFDYFFGFKSGYIDYYQHTGGDGMNDLYENNTPTHVDGYMTDLITDRAMRFIEQNAARPFFLEVTYNAAHWPYQVPDRPSVAIGNARHVMPQDDNTSTRADYVAIMERADQGVGQILRTLDRLALAPNTLVIYTNDNGGEWLASNAPMFNRKWTLWEGGIRVPALLRWPGHIPPGRVTDQVGITMDLSASILAATNSPVPPETRLEGINLLPILEGRSPEVERTLFWRTESGRSQKAVRSGDWKLLVDGTQELLFNVRTDVSERRDLTREHPDVVARLRPLIAKWEADVDAEARINVPNGGGAAGRGGAANVVTDPAGRTRPID